jgi:spore germination protein GerM
MFDSCREHSFVTFIQPELIVRVLVATVPSMMKVMARAIGVMSVVVLMTSNCGGAGTETSTSSSSVMNSTTTVVASTRAIFLVKNGSTEFTLEKILITDEVTASDLTDQVRRALVALLQLTGTTLDDYNREEMTDLGTAIPQGISIQNLDIMDGVVILDLDDNVRLTSGSSSEEMLFAQQLAHTALLDSSLNELRVLINGEAISELWGHIDWSMPITADPSLVVSG